MTNLTSDCGCGGKKRPAARSGATTDARGRQPDLSGMSTANHSATRVSDTVAVDGFRALNPVDGLFLTAEHLDAMQNYARSLTVALATATGPGVVHGLGVTLDVASNADTPAIVVSPGLAITPHGQPLQLSSSMRIPLKGNLTGLAPSDGFWRIELHPASRTSGSAPVYGSLCNDGCADGSGAAIQPWRDEGVEIQFVPDTMKGLDGVLSLRRRRNWLASAYFERERSRGGPWLTPTTDGRSVASLDSQDWDDGTPLPPADTGVPLAVLQPIGDGRVVLDMWTARRLVDGPQTSNTWRNRLAMRPWSIFLAQILQFQDELAWRPDPTSTDESAIVAKVVGGSSVSDSAATRAAQQQVAKYARVLIASCKPSNPLWRWPPVQNLASALEDASAALAIDTEDEQPPANAAVPDLSWKAEGPRPNPQFGELPPAGYLSANERQDDEALIRDLESRLFGGQRVSLRIRRMRADQIADEVLTAQHRDRIPLSENMTGLQPQVDICVPSDSADKAELNVAGYGWVAFVRRGPGATSHEEPAPPTEPVTVYLCTVGKNPWVDLGENPLDKATELMNSADWKSIELDTFEYPSNPDEYQGRIATEKIFEEIRKRIPYALIALASSTASMPLAALRASLLGASLDSGNPLPVYALNKGLDAIVIVAEDYR